MISKSNFSSPLRYPGGKSKISPFIEDIILINNLDNCVLYELYAGGAGASLNILLAGLCDKIVLNDLDFHLYAFWYSVLNHTEELNRRIKNSKIDISNWSKQKHIYENYNDHDIIDVGFSTFFLNRTNRSGILFKAGPIGGLNQNGKYSIDVRFNKEKLIKRIEKIAVLRNRICLYNEESISLLKTLKEKIAINHLFFLDPPYFNKSENLYFNSYISEDHINLSAELAKNENFNWLVTYDNCDEIISLYSNYRMSYLPMTYTVQNKRKAKEVMIFSNSLSLPTKLRVGSKLINLKINNNNYGRYSTNTI